MAETHSCPRRMAEIGPWKRDKGLDTWTERAGLIGQPRGCSFCGSMHPDDFMQAVRDHLQIGPTDKSYKLYVKGIPAPHPDALRVLSTSNQAGPGLKAWKDLTRAEKKAVREFGTSDGYKDRYYQFMPWGPTVEGKFYTHHLSEAQGDEFDQLWTKHKINWGYPGAPYRPLYIPGQPKRGGDAASS